jgi:hypothetical protein
MDDTDNYLLTLLLYLPTVNIDLFQYDLWSKNKMQYQINDNYLSLLKGIHELLPSFKGDGTFNLTIP